MLVFSDIGSNIGPHSLTVAAMQREVVVVDAVFYNLALISLSHKITNKGKVKILYNSISDKQGEQLYPYLEAQHQHMAGATYLVTKEDLDSGKYKWEEVIGPPAVSVTTKDIFDQIDSDVVIIKIDVEGHECKVCSLGLFITSRFLGHFHFSPIPCHLVSSLDHVLVMKKNLFIHL